MTYNPTPVDHRARHHAVTDYVHDAVRAGRLTPGDRVHETSLARALDVSLSPVRESLFRLADQGWLEHRPRRGFYVRTFTPAETQEIYTFRALLEGFAARTVAERWSGAIPEEDVALEEEMAQLIVEGQRVPHAGGRVAVGHVNARFHDCLIRLAGSALLRRSWALLAPADWLLIPTWGDAPPDLTPAETADWVARHQRILTLLEGGDSAAAARELEEHVREAGEGNLRRRFPHITQTTETATVTPA